MIFCKVVPQSMDNIEEIPTTLVRSQSQRITNKDEAWAALLNAPGFIKYINTYSWHFTPELADFASGLMENSDKSNHRWTTKSLVKTLVNKGFKIPEELVTWGDIAYTANMAYADFYPSICKSEDDCLEYAKLVANDVDGYFGMIFHRWIADVIGKTLVINWENYL